MADPAVVAARLQAVAHHFPLHQHALLVSLCQTYQHSAQTAIGTYRFGWKQLAPSTLARKGANTPLYERGDLQKSIEYRVSSNTEADVGTNHRVARWQELGTSRGIPPRPFMGGALGEMDSHVNRIVEQFVARAFT